MTKKKIFLIGVAALLVGGVYFYLYKDWFASPDIQILHRISAGRTPRHYGRRASGDDGTANLVSFGLNRKLKLTELKVVALSELETNKNAHPIWHLVSDSNSVPIKGFVYGEKIQGMRPYVEGAHADALEPNVTYRLFVEAGSATGEHDFKTTQKSVATR